MASAGQSMAAAMGSGDFTALTQAVDALRAEAAKPGDHKEVLEINATVAAGMVQLRLGGFDAAEKSFREAAALAEKKYGPTHLASIAPRLGVAQCLVMGQRFDAAETLLTELRADAVKASGEHSMLGMQCDVLLGLVALRKTPSGADEDDTPANKGKRDKSVEHFQRALATAKRLKLENSQVLLGAYQGLSHRLLTADTPKALEYALKAEELGRGPPALPGNAQAYLRLGTMLPLVRMRKYQEAEPVCKQLLADLKSYPELESSRGVIELGLTRTLVFGRKSAEAEPHCLANIARVEKLGSRRQLAFAYSLHIQNAIGLGDAEVVSTELKRIEEALAGASEADRLAVLTDLRQVGRDASTAKKPDLAVAIHTTTHRLLKTHFTANHNDTAVAAGDLAHALGVVRKDDGREQLYREAMDGTAAAMGVDHEHTRLCANNLVSYLRVNDRQADAVAVLVGLYERVEKAKGPSADVTRTRGRAAIDLCKSLGRWADAVPVARKLLAANAAARTPDEADAMNAHLLLGQCLLRAGKAGDAVPHLRDALDRGQSKYPTHAYIAVNKFWLAEALLAVGKPHEAEPLLLEAYPKLRATAKPDPDATPFAALDVIVRMYTAAGKGDEVKKWTAERDQLAATADEGAVESLPKLLALSKETPADTLLTLKIAALQAWFGLNADLGRTRERALLFAKDTKDPAVAERSAKLCGFGATTTKERMQESLTLARRAVELGKDAPLKHYYLMCQGMLEYRDKDYAAADKTLTAAGFTDPVNEHVFLTCSFYRAMALFRSKKNDAAKELAVAAVKKMRPLPADKARPLAGGYNADDLIVFLAFQEAKELIGFDGPTTASAPPKK